MINFDYIKKENIKEHNPNWPRILDHPCRLLITEGSRITRQVTNQISIKICFHAKDPCEAEYQLLIKKEKVQN